MLNDSLLQSNDSDSLFQSFSPFSNVENTGTTITYAVLIALGLLVNIYVVIIFFMKNDKRTKFCRFLLHLSLINIGQYIGIIPYLTMDLRKIPLQNKYFESILCSISDGHSTMLVFSMASCVLLTFMSILRCELMINPFRKLINDQNLNKVFTITWLFGCLSFLPYMLSYRLDHKAGICFRKWVINDSFGFTYMSIMYTFGLIIPILAMITACIASYIKLNSGNFNENSVQKKRKNVLIRLTCLIVIFTMTWFPYSVYWLMTYTTYVVNDTDNQLKRLKVLRYVLMPSLFGGIIGPLFNIHNWAPFRKSIQEFISNCRQSTERSKKVSYAVNTKVESQTESSSNQQSDCSYY